MPNTAHPGTAAPLPSLQLGLLGPALLRLYRHEVEQDFAIWKYKRYVDPPRAHRKWVRQFYE
jgi:hypothetical protein